MHSSAAHNQEQNQAKSHHVGRRSVAASSGWSKASERTEVGDWRGERVGARGFTHVIFSRRTYPFYMPLVIPSIINCQADESFLYRYKQKSRPWRIIVGHSYVFLLSMPERQQNVMSSGHILPLNIKVNDEGNDGMFDTLTPQLPKKDGEKKFVSI
jgi:hypothetical protein